MEVLIYFIEEDRPKKGDFRKVAQLRKFDIECGKAEGMS